MRASHVCPTGAVRTRTPNKGLVAEFPATHAEQLITVLNLPANDPWFTWCVEDLLKFAPRPTGVGEMFQLLRDGQPRTRADLATITGQARSTIATRLDLLLTAGLIGQVGEASSTGGRPPATFAFRPNAKIVLAFDVGVSQAHLAITDLASSILAEADEALAIADGPDVVLPLLAEAAKKLVATADRSLEDLGSIGIGLPGPIEHATGRPVSPPLMPSWDNVDSTLR